MNNGVSEKELSAQMVAELKEWQQLSDAIAIHNDEDERIVLSFDFLIFGTCEKKECACTASNAVSAAGLLQLLLRLKSSDSVSTDFKPPPQR